MHINPLNSFDEVAAWYEKTKPVISKKHTAEQDVRPIGERRRKYERIIKITKNCYALSCGDNADPVFNWGFSDYVAKYPVTPKETERLSPIVWRKHSDGSETITIRNGQGDWQHNAVYSFLQRALPTGLYFCNGRNGVQHVRCHTNGTYYYLPKTKTVPKHVYERYKEQAASGANWAKQQLKESMSDFDNLSLTFKRVGDRKFELLGEAPKEVVKRTRVDKDAKLALKPQIEEVFQWAATMYPLMRTQLNWNLKAEIRQRLGEIATERKIEGYYSDWSRLFGSCTPDLVRAIIANPEHPMRYEFGVATMFEIDSAMDTDADGEKGNHSLARTAYNKWINRVAGFAKIIKEEK